MKQRGRAKQKPSRLTITFRPGQREALQAVADKSYLSLAHVIRYALDQFIGQGEGRRLAPRHRSDA